MTILGGLAWAPLKTPKPSYPLKILSHGSSQTYDSLKAFSFLEVWMPMMIFQIFQHFHHSTIYPTFVFLMRHMHIQVTSDNVSLMITQHFFLELSYYIQNFIKRLIFINLWLKLWNHIYYLHSLVCIFMPELCISEVFISIKSISYFLCYSLLYYQNNLIFNKITEFFCSILRYFA